jgi:hypothetical protein
LCQALYVICRQDETSFVCQGCVDREDLGAADAERRLQSQHRVGLMSLHHIKDRCHVVEVKRFGHGGDFIL